MGARNRVENRAYRIYEFLSTHLGEGFTIGQLCGRLNISDGTTTRSAIRRARDLATESGLHFPPAVPQNAHQYMVTRLPEDALDPTLHMGRIKHGVARREQVGVNFLERERRHLPGDLKPIADFYIEMMKTWQRAEAELLKLGDDMVISLVKIRREQRRGETPQ